MAFSSHICCLIILAYTFFKIIECYHKDPPVPFSLLATCQESYIKATECQHYFPIDTLKNYKNNHYKVRVKFYTMAACEVNIILTDKLKDPRTKYRAVIGGKRNTVSYLRKDKADNNPYSSNEIQKIMHPLWPTPIWIQQAIEGKIEISIPNVAEPLLTLDAPDFHLTYICVYAWDRPSRWFYNCNEDEDQLLQQSDCTKSDPAHNAIDIRISV